MGNLTLLVGIEGIWRNDSTACSDQEYLMVGTSYRQLQLKQGPKYSQWVSKRHNRGQERCGEEQEAERCWWKVMV